MVGNEREVLAMLKLAVWAGKLTPQAVLCPWPGEAVLLPAELEIPKLVHVCCCFFRTLFHFPAMELLSCCLACLCFAL